MLPHCHAIPKAFQVSMILSNPNAASFRVVGCTPSRSSLRIPFLLQRYPRKTLRTATRHFSRTARRRDVEKPYYVTTPIFYVNAAPHVGHLYSMVLADIYKRWEVLKGRRAILCTGTDEHGMKVQRAAEDKGIEPRAFCDQGAEVFRELAAAANISNDHFIRTSEQEHKDSVQYAWTKLRDKGLIYLSKHEGWYAVSDEAFYTESDIMQTVDPRTGRKMMASIETGKEVEWTEETNYRFRLTEFRDQLLQFYRSNPDFVIPKPRMSEIVQWVTAGFPDLSVSRPSSRLTWGVSVPNDDTQTIYVWLDALVNYITRAGYPWPPGKESAGGWPADIQVVGKDISRFHAVYWPAFLFGLDLPPPKQIVAHAHWTLGRQKMAKSTGNVVNPFFAMQRYGVDVIRFFLAHDGGLRDDSDYSNESIETRYKKTLHGSLGNLASRICRGKQWSVEKSVEHVAPNGPKLSQSSTKGQWNMIKAMLANIEKDMAALNISAAVKNITNIVYSTNSFLHETAPWELAKAENDPEAKELLDEVIYTSVEALRIVGILLQPVMPTKMSLLLDMLGVDPSRRTHADAQPGADANYGKPKVDIGRGLTGVLFPPIPPGVHSVIE